MMGGTIHLATVRRVGFHGAEISHKPRPWRAGSLSVSRGRPRFQTCGKDFARELSHYDIGCKPCGSGQLYDCCEAGTLNRSEQQLLSGRNIFSARPFV